MKCDNAIFPYVTTLKNSLPPKLQKTEKATNTPTKAVACKAITNKPQGTQFPSQSTWH